MPSLGKFLIGGIAVAALGQYLGTSSAPTPLSRNTQAVVQAPKPFIKPPPPAYLRETPVSIGQIGIDPYTRTDYPDVVRQFGKITPIINRERKQVAKIVSFDTRCDGVQNVQITERSTGVNRHYMAECDNSTRFYFTPESLTTGEPAKIQTIEDMTEHGPWDW